MKIIEREALSFSHVTFERDDSFGEIMAWISLVPMGFYVIEFTFAIVSSLSVMERNSAVMILIGQMLNECLSYALKDVFKEVRPSGTERYDYGMPSSHAQFMGFLLGTFGHILPLTIFKYLPTFISYALAIAGSSVVCCSRVYLKYHDVRQVLVGFLLGFGIGSLWAGLMDILLRDRHNKKKTN